MTGQFRKREKTDVFSSTFLGKRGGGVSSPRRRAEAAPRPVAQLVQFNLQLFVKQHAALRDTVSELVSRCQCCRDIVVSVVVVRDKRDISSAQPSRSFFCLQKINLHPRNKNVAFLEVCILSARSAVSLPAKYPVEFKKNNKSIRCVKALSVAKWEYYCLPSC